jgi:hypothetical protein
LVKNRVINAPPELESPGCATAQFIDHYEAGCHREIPRSSPLDVMVERRHTTFAVVK